MKNLQNSKFEIRPLVWKGENIDTYSISNTGILYRHNEPRNSWVVNGRNYSNVTFPNGKRKHLRLDYMVAYTFLPYYEDIIRLVHIDDNLQNDNVDNLIWYRKVDVMKEYIDMAIIDDNMEIEEEWRPCILQYECKDSYEVSNFGMIRFKDNKELVPIYENHSYRVFYYIDKNFADQTRVESVHRAVAKAFIPNPNNYPLVNHLDGNKNNNMVTNLEWASLGMNSEHAYLSGLNNRVMYTRPQIEYVCRLLASGKLQQIQISHMTGVDRKTISDIFRGRRWADVSSMYKFKERKWTPEIKNQVCDLILKGFKGKEIFEKLDIEYDQSATSFYERMRRDLRKSNKLK